MDSKLPRPPSPPIRASVAPKIRIKPETGSLRYTDLKNLANKGFTIFCLGKQDYYI